MLIEVDEELIINTAYLVRVVMNNEGITLLWQNEDCDTFTGKCADKLKAAIKEAMLREEIAYTGKMGIK